jgi:hypothetical protein
VQNNLGRFYEFGHGVPQDYMRAYMCYNVAAANSTGDTSDGPSNRIEVRLQVAVTPAQMVDAKKHTGLEVESKYATMAYRGIYMKRLLLFILLVLNSGPAYAEWVKVRDGDGAGKTVYVDPTTIRRNSNLVKMWQFYDYKSVQTVGGVRFLSAKEQWEFDCVEERSRVVALKEFSGNMGSGTVVYTNSQVGKWIPVMPGSIGQTVWKVACSKD